MRRTVLPIAVVLLTAACGSDVEHASNSPSTPSRTAQTSRTGSTPPAATSKTPSPRKGCKTTRDVIVWVKAAGVPDNAQVLGNYNLGNCEPTFEWLQRTSPTEAGDCTEAAWASDNPGYDADAIPAAPLKKVQMAVGPAC